MGIPKGTLRLIRDESVDELVAALEVLLCLAAEVEETTAAELVVATAAEVALDDVLTTAAATDATEAEVVANEAEAGVEELET